jgi:hypothetical protein
MCTAVAILENSPARKETHREPRDVGRMAG